MINVRDWVDEAQQAAERRLQLCEAWQYYYEDGRDNGEDPPDDADPSLSPFDGSETCIIREVLDAAWPIMEEGVRSRDFDYHRSTVSNA